MRQRGAFLLFFALPRPPDDLMPAIASGLALQVTVWVARIISHLTKTMQRHQHDAAISSDEADHFVAIINGADRATRWLQSTMDWSNADRQSPLCGSSQTVTLPATLFS
jgi:hypothetical protein